MNLDGVHQFLINQPLVILFVVVASGLLLGRFKVKGIGLGSSGVLFMALLAGHLGYSIPAGVGTLGLVLFVYCVGISAGDRFFAALRREGATLAKLAIVIVTVGAGVTWIGARLLDLPAALATGIFAGALTSTPALAAASEAALVGADAVSIGYGIAYPFGVIGVVLFVQVVPRFLKINMNPMNASDDRSDIATQREDSTDLFSLAVGLALGILLGLIPLGPARLGLAGGPLLMALILGHFRKIGPIVGSMPRSTRTFLQELGLVFFLANAGIRGGGTLVSTLEEHGLGLFGLGLCISCLPLVVAWPISIRVFGMNPLQALGGICGGMTSTPALGAITSKTDSKIPVISYVSAYPVALVFMIIVSKILIAIIN